MAAKEVNVFLKEIRKLTHKQKLALRDFDHRMASLYNHKKAIQRLSLVLTLLKEKDKKSVRKQILKEIKFIKHELISEFAAVIEGVIKDRDVEISLFKKEHEKYKIQTEKSMHELEILVEHHAKGGETKQKAIEDATVLLKEVRKDLKGTSIVKEIRAIVKNINTILKTQSKILINELNILSSIEQLMKSEKFSHKEIDQAIDKVKNVIADLVYILQTEKERVIDPFNKFLKEKRTALRLAEKRGRQRQITLDDISRDIETFTEPFEVKLYISTLGKYANKISSDAQDIPELTRHIETVLHYHKKKRHDLQKALKIAPKTI